MKTYGLTHEQLAMVSVVQREWAAKNPRATFKTPITVEDVLNSRMIAYPFRLLQCCLVTDGGGALILVAAERARDFPQKPAYLLGTGESAETPMVSQMEDFTSSRAFRVAGAKAFAEAGITHNDVDHLTIYDAFAHLPIYGLEDLVPETARQGPKNGIDPCLIAAFAAEPFEKVGVQPHRHGLLPPRHENTRVLPESLVGRLCIGIVDDRGVRLLLGHRAETRSVRIEPSAHPRSGFRRASAACLARLGTIQTLIDSIQTSPLQLPASLPSGRFCCPPLSAAVAASR